MVDSECQDNYSAVIRRTWTAVDESGNVNSCVHEIKLRKASISEIDFAASLPNYTGLDGGQPAINASKDNSCEPNTSPGLVIDGECPDGEGNHVGERTRAGNGGDSGEPTGFPMLKGLPVARYKSDDTGLSIGYQYLWDSYGFCEISVDYTDQILPLCVGTYKILRTWTLIDWCTNEIVEHLQIIKVVDEEASIDCPEDITLRTNYNSKACEADFDIPDGQIWESCGEVANATVSIIGSRLAQNSFGSWVEESYYVLDKRPGTVSGSASGDPVIIEFGSVKLKGPDCSKDAESYKVIYEYVDHCGNKASCEYNVTVNDETEPTPVCQTSTTISVGANCEAVVLAEDLDQGSYDNCSDELKFTARRMDQGGEFKDHVKFDDTDVWNTLEGNPVLVEVQVTDCHGNFNTCMVEVYVNDKQKPVIKVSDATLCCEDLENNGVIPVVLIPVVAVTDNCEGEYAIHTEVSDWRNDCHIGTVTYTYTATDRHGNVSDPVEQVITIEDCTPLEVTFPDDYTAFCTAGDGSGYSDPLSPDVTGRSSVSGDDCELVAVSYEDQVFEVTNDACFKIIRSWTVIDWCAYDPDHPSDDAYFSGTQIIKVKDDTAPQLEAPSDQKVCIDGTSDCATAITVGAPA